MKSLIGKLETERRLLMSWWKDMRMSQTLHRVEYETCLDDLSNINVKSPTLLATKRITQPWRGVNATLEYRLCDETAKGLSGVHQVTLRSTRPIRNENKPKYFCCCLAAANCPTLARPPLRAAGCLGVWVVRCSGSTTLSLRSVQHVYITQGQVSMQSPPVPRAAAVVGGLTRLSFKEKEHSNQIIFLFCCHI